MNRTKYKPDSSENSEDSKPSSRMPHKIFIISGACCSLLIISCCIFFLNYHQRSANAEDISETAECTQAESIEDTEAESSIPMTSEPADETVAETVTETVPETTLETVIETTAEAVTSSEPEDTENEEGPSRAEVIIGNYAHANNIPVSSYPADYIKLLNLIPESESYVLHLPRHEYVPLDMSGYNPDDMPLFIQWDPMWGYEPYGAGTIGINGCAPTCLAMAGFYVTGDPKFNPIEMAKFAESEGFYLKGAGTYSSFVPQGGKRLGLDIVQISNNKEQVLSNLDAGNPIICQVDKGDFTTVGHYIMMAHNIDGKLQINDPNSITRSQKLWEFDDIQSQMIRLWAVRKS